MSEEYESLRDRIRTNLIQQRRTLRQIDLTIRRTQKLDTEIKIECTQEEVVNIIHKIKKKGFVDSGQLNVLRNFLSVKENIPVFFKYTGALPGLVGELTGSDTCKQMLAAECLCHLTLGTEANCLCIAKAAGVYLIAFLTGPNYSLASICGLTIGNIVCSSYKACEILREQGLVKTLLPLLVSDQEEIKTSAMCALSHILLKNPSVVRMDELCQIVDPLNDFADMSRQQARLLFIVSSNGSEVCPAVVENRIFTKMLEKLVEIVSDKEWENDHAIVVYLLRSIANTVCDSTIVQNECDVLLKQDSVNVFRKLLTCQRKNILSNLLWYFGNVVNHRHLSDDWKSSYISLFSDVIGLCI